MDATDERHKCVQRARSEEGKALMRCRGSTVERSFADLKQHHGFRRFSTFGKAKARLEFGLLVLAYNLGRLLSLLGTPTRLINRIHRQFIAWCAHAWSKYAELALAA
jgi:Transposase DDE domain